MAAVVMHWWNNILGFHRLNAEAGQFMKGADRGTGVLVCGGYDPTTIDVVDGARETDDGRVAVANHRATFWCNAWDSSTGVDPRSDGDEDENDQAARIEAEHEAADFSSTDSDPVEDAE